MPNKLTSMVQKCTNCDASYNPDDLYCLSCGFILPAALESDNTRIASMLPGSTGNLQWGTGYFHHRARLFFRLEDSDQSILVPLASGSIIVGRNSETASVDLDLTRYDAANLGVSRRHVRIERVRDVLQLSDLDSANGTYLNRERLAPGVTHTLRNRAILQLGRMIMRIQFT
jgi:hypothetical protein